MPSPPPPRRRSPPPVVRPTSCKDDAGARSLCPERVRGPVPASTALQRFHTLEGLLEFDGALPLQVLGTTSGLWPKLRRRNGANRVHSGVQNARPAQEAAVHALHHPVIPLRGAVADSGSERQAEHGGYRH